MDNEINFQSTAIQQHISILQDIIARLANNSNNYKKWCLAITAAIWTILASNKQTNHCYYAIFPILLCCYLDTYYLCLERNFIKKHEDFIKKLHLNELNSTDIYVLKSEKISFCQMFRSFFSKSVFIFYIPLIMICLYFSYKGLT